MNLFSKAKKTAPEKSRVKNQRLGRLTFIHVSLLYNPDLEQKRFQILHSLQFFFVTVQYER